MKRPKSDLEFCFWLTFGLQNCLSRQTLSQAGPVITLAGQARHSEAGTSIHLHCKTFLTLRADLEGPHIRLDYETPHHTTTQDLYHQQPVQHIVSAFETRVTPDLSINSWKSWSQCTLNMPVGPWHPLKSQKHSCSPTQHNKIYHKTLKSRYSKSTIVSQSLSMTSRVLRASSPTNLSQD